MRMDWTKLPDELNARADEIFASMKAVPPINVSEHTQMQTTALVFKGLALSFKNSLVAEPSEEEKQAYYSKHEE